MVGLTKEVVVSNSIEKGDVDCKVVMKVPVEKEGVGGAHDEVETFCRSIEMLSDVVEDTVLEHGGEVMEVSARCCGYFGFKYSRPYTPRSSLLYGELTEEKNERVQKRVLELDQEIVGFTFEVSEIGLAETDTEDKSLKSWEIVEIMKLY
ncbi:uncharacterized protein A4U43_C05F9870 [Asparagus officinalis]|uniref:DUF7811 domain-containing protein n=1 Tax=Asparagus officinalis TaxID=4686 RepID=A0A5P1EVZ3_ASPOF|nr:uncharacterized protein A4U43_C05F9870 [Asparagus officinalis]